MPEMKYYDPSETIRGIQQILGSDKKKIAFLFGAGTSAAKHPGGAPNIPGVAEMTEVIVGKISEDATYKPVMDAIRAELAGTHSGFNIETLLTNVEDKIRIIGNGILNNIDRSKFEDLRRQIKDNIRKIVSIHDTLTDERKHQMVQYDFAKWLKNADRKYAVEIFTTNYDYLIEVALEEMDIPYYDGFTGGYMPFFNADSLEEKDFLPRQTKLWKIHGSLGLRELDSGSQQKIIRTRSDSGDLLIYPSSFKYSNSKKLPYAAFLDRLNSFLKQDDAVLFVCGYSFGDEHINERILSALNTSSTSHVFVLFYDIDRSGGNRKYTLTPDCKLAQIASSNRRMSVLGTRNAIIGSAYGAWKLKREPDRDDPLNIQLYFDEDAPVNVGAEIKAEMKGDEIWTGKGELILPDFSRFVKFLKNMIPQSIWEDSANG